MSGSNVTQVEYVPPCHVMRGFIGDGIPFEDQALVADFPGLTPDSSTWTVIASLIDNEGASIYDYSVLLEDTGDDATLSATELRITLSPIPGSNSTNLGVGTFTGYVQVTPLAGEPRTMFLLEVEIKKRTSG